MLDLEPIKARSEAATAGPWFSDSYGEIHSRPLSDEYVNLESRLLGASEDEWEVAEFPETGVACITTGKQKEDAEFIANARSDVDALVAEVERLVAAVSSSTKGPEPSETVR